MLSAVKSNATILMTQSDARVKQESSVQMKYVPVVNMCEFMLITNINIGLIYKLLVYIQASHNIVK